MKLESREYHHIWCNHFNKDPREGCKMCDGLFKEYPMDKHPDEMLKEHFPDAKVVK